MHVLVYGMVGNHRGGIETYLLKMNSFMSKDMVFDYVIEETECLHEEAIASRGGRIYRVPSRNRNPLGNINANRKLLKELKNHINTVYFNLSSLSWIEPIRIAKMLGYRVFVHSHNSQFINSNNSLPYRLVNAINKRRLSTYKGIKRLTCSQPATDFMFMKKDAVEMIYNAIYVKDFLYDEKVRREKRNELGIEEDDFLIGFVGRLQDQKNPLYLPTIMKAVLTRNKRAKMIIVGEGRMRKELEDKIKEYGFNSSMFLLGNRTDVNKLMQAMDVFVLPSLHEGLPYVVVEAQASGLKCFISDGITTEVDVTGSVKFLNLLPDASNWGEAIVTESKSSYNDRKEKGEFMNTTNFNIEREARRLESILSGVNKKQ